MIHVSSSYGFKTENSPAHGENFSSREEYESSKEAETEQSLGDYFLEAMKKELMINHI